MTKYQAGEQGGEPSVSVVRACVAGVPPGFQLIEIDDVEDSVWGVDGMDL